MSEFKNLKFHSVIPQDILQAVGLFDKLGYEAGCDFSADDAARHNGVCAWDDGEITEGWLYDDNFYQVTLEDLKEMVGETDRCNKDLEVGSRVTLSSDTSWYLSKDNPIGINGTIREVDWWVWVKWDNGASNAYIPYDKDLVLVEENENV